MKSSPRPTKPTLPTTREMTGEDVKNNTTATSNNATNEDDDDDDDDDSKTFFRAKKSSSSLEEEEEEENDGAAKKRRRLLLDRRIMGVPPPTTTETKVAKATRLESVRVVAGEKKIGFVENERDLNKTKEEEEEKKKTLDYYSVDANECVHFSIVDKTEEEEEKEGNNNEEAKKTTKKGGHFFSAAASKEKRTFEPEFTHQVFRDDETIYGYSEDLRVEVMCLPNVYERYVDVSYSEKVRSSLNPADDIRANLNGWFPEEGTMATKEAFMKRAKETSEMEIPGNGGKVIAEWDGEGEESELKYSIRQYEFKDSERTTVGRWHDNVEPFVAFYIDAASKIDKNDGRWLWFVLIAQRKDNLKRWATCGFTTVYQFYAHPFQRRLRISQVLVLPPYQRKGFGAKLLDAVRAYARMQDEAGEGKEVADITVEDPTDQLQRLRDVRDCIAATENKDIVLAVKTAARRAFAAAQSSTADPLHRKQKLKQAQAALRLPKRCYETNFKKDLKICEPQAKRVWEALLFVWAKQCQAPSEGVVADAFRTNVLNRLKKKHMASLGKGEDDVGSKRIRDTKDGGFVMCKGGGEGERVEIEDTLSIPTAETRPRDTRENEDEDEDATPKDPAEALAQLFHECMQNLAYLSTVVAKLSSSSKSEE